MFALALAGLNDRPVDGHDGVSSQSNASTDHAHSHDLGAMDSSDPIPSDPPMRWWRGNLHTHSFWSDGDDFPEMIAEWYRTHDYHFLALSDHNVLSEGDRWMDQSAIEKRGGKEVMNKYRQRFGGGWVQTRQTKDGTGFQVRLKPLSEFGPLMQQRGQFILIPGEEISDWAEGKPVHMNATNLQEPIQPLGGKTVAEAISNNLRAVQDQAKRTGRTIMMHLNHPNFGYAVTAEDLAQVIEERFFEVYNGHPSINHLGDDEHPSVERIWDVANAMRLGVLTAEPLLGIATDDSHQYHGKPGGAHPGRGWVMVRSKYLTPEHLILAMRRGDFYASSGVHLSKLDFDSAARTLSLQIEAEAGETYKTELIATRQPDTAETMPAADQIGVVLAAQTGTEVVFQIPDDVLYVRAVITSDQPPRDPSFEGQFKQAWTQPVGWRKP
ncbi:PHP domain-containing protein [Neorhodopirellula pilleata]|nr:hypothetical protein [Neorhodopirellula pilleata]